MGLLHLGFLGREIRRMIEEHGRNLLREFRGVLLPISDVRQLLRHGWIEREGGEEESEEGRKERG